METVLPKEDATTAQRFEHVFNHFLLLSGELLEEQDDKEKLEVTDARKALRLFKRTWEKTSPQNRILDFLKVIMLMMEKHQKLIRDSSGIDSWLHEINFRLCYGETIGEPSKKICIAVTAILKHIDNFENHERVRAEFLYHLYYLFSLCPNREKCKLKVELEERLGELEEDLDEEFLKSFEPPATPATGGAFAGMPDIAGMLSSLGDNDGLVKTVTNIITKPEIAQALASNQKIANPEVKAPESLPNTQ